jgi:hypothetical protein
MDFKKAIKFLPDNNNEDIAVLKFDPNKFPQCIPGIFLKRQEIITLMESMPIVEVKGHLGIIKFKFGMIDEEGKIYLII